MAIFKATDEYNPNAPNGMRRLSNGTQMVSFPADIGASKYFTVINIVEYHRTPAMGQDKPKVKGTLVLPLPFNMEQKYNANWKEFGNAIIGNIASLDEIGSLSDVAQAAKLGGAAIAKDVLANYFKKTGGYNDAIKTIGTGLSMATGVVTNPHLTATFEGMNLRQFSLPWKLSARNQAESAKLLQIISALKKAMHPSYLPSTNKFFLQFPDQVTIDFMGVDDTINDIKRSVITSLDIDITQGGKPSFRADGTPVEVSMTLNLQETEIRTDADFDLSQQQQVKAIQNAIPPNLQ